ncbi:hypothetical protein GCM10010293_49840 [Streptomyces griseoflavus]|nr:hypothetical protein GCM10010293_49840 [Streptomyces griseoflavus]
MNDHHTLVRPHQDPHQRWHTRLNRRTAANPHIPTGPASPALTCRELITYPETVILAAALDHLPLSPATRRTGRLRPPPRQPPAPAPPHARRPRPAPDTPDHPLKASPAGSRAHRRVTHPAQTNAPLDSLRRPAAAQPARVSAGGPASGQAGGPPACWEQRRATG